MLVLGSAGGNSSFGGLASAIGGQAGGNGAPNTGGGGGLGGAGAGTGLLVTGQTGGSSFLAGSDWVSGRGGGAFGGAGAESVIGVSTGTTNGHASTLPGAGGAGGVGSGIGGQGGPWLSSCRMVIHSAGPMVFAGW